MTAGTQLSSGWGCPSTSTCVPAAGDHLVALAGSGYNPWTLDLDIAVLRVINGPPVFRGTPTAVDG
ncbi:hypothetical protein ACFVZJ_34170, partial [Streptomyces sp. NPDC058322]|uniref:hypothetical protein n=1 Tax=Streptomyces sp. NPDC058322 TaxID=3346446 RepID=UPI0036E2BF96